MIINEDKTSLFYVTSHLLLKHFFTFLCLHACNMVIYLKTYSADLDSMLRLKLSPDTVSVTPSLVCEYVGACD